MGIAVGLGIAIDRRHEFETAARLPQAARTTGLPTFLWDDVPQNGRVAGHESVAMRFVLIAALASGLCGCATLSRGTTDEVSVISDPVGAEVTTSFGSHCSTPCSLAVARDQVFSLTIAKDGYEAQKVDVVTRLSGAGLAAATENLVTAGLGATVDAATGATLEHIPNPVNVTLVKRLSAAAARKPRHAS